MPTSSRTRSQPRVTPEAAPASRSIPAVLLLLALAGIGVAVYLWVVHQRARAGIASACDVNATVSCSDVARSKYAVLFGVPIAAWGALAYLTIAGLAATALRRRRPSASWPGGLLFVLCGSMVLGAIALAAISELVLHRFCIMCAVSWAISIALFALTIPLVRRAGGVGAALRADLGDLRGNRGAAWGGAAVLAALAIGLLAVGPSPKKDGGGTRGTGGRPPVLGTGIAPIPKGPPGSLVIYEYSDYLCPYCKVMNDAERSIVMRRPDVRFVRRHYPLDSTCNPDLQRQVHAGACDLARGAICAERLGRFEAYDDLVFASQGSKVNPEVIAMQAALDLAAFRDCLSSPETDERIAADIQAARQARIQSTPSLEVRGKVYSLDELYPLLGLDPRGP